MTPLDQVATPARERALARASVLADWRASGLDADAFAERYNAKPSTEIQKISRGTLYRWRKAEENGGLDALLPGYKPVRGAGSRSLAEADKRVLESLYLQQSRPSAEKCARDAETVLGYEISHRAARAYLQSLPRPLVVRHREGATKYQERCLPYLNRRFEDLAAMDKVNADHHRFDFLVTHEGRTFRPWLTMFQDIASRKPLAWMVSEQPNELVIASTFRTMLEDYGLPKELSIDNGRDFKSELLNGKDQTAWSGVFGSLGVSVHFVQPYHGQSKPVERQFRTVAEEFSKMMETYVGSNTAERGEDAQLYYRTVRRKQKKAVTVTLADAEEAFDAWIQRWAATWHHQGRGMNSRTPNEVFAATWQTRRVYDPVYDHLVFARRFERTITQNGIRIGQSDYWADELHLALGSRVTVARPIWDLSLIHVYDAEGRYIASARRADWDQTGATEEDLRRLQTTHRRLRDGLSRLGVDQHVRRAVLSQAREAARAPITPIPLHPAEEEVVNLGPVPTAATGDSKILPFANGRNRPKTPNRKDLFSHDE